MNIHSQRPYRHFKGRLYYVHHIGNDTETNEVLVSYQALYPPYQMYIRSKKIFLERIDVGREDNITNQEHRFELYKG